MLNWYKNLYVGDTARKKQKKWMRRIENKKAVPGVWLLTLPSNQQNNLDVIPADLLLQPAVRRNCPMIVGLAVSREEAFELVEAIALETYRETGEVKIREWLLNRIEGGKRGILFNRRSGGKREEKSCQRMEKSQKELKTYDRSS